MTVLIQFCELAIGNLPRGRETARCLQDTIAGQKRAYTSSCSVIWFPIGLGRKADDISSKLIPMRFVTLIYDNLDLQPAWIVHSSKRKCQMIWGSRVLSVDRATAGRTKDLGHLGPNARCVTELA